MIEAIVYLFIGAIAALLAYFTYFKGGAEKKPLFFNREPVFESTPRRIVKVDMSPVSGACSQCGEGTTLPFKCKFCGNLFCSEHRLPENHGCANLR